ncbi:MAG: hypothetical protein E7679_03015 [Ruminococcaceae bacterium]|nr:hypothetical protein [Oscillospiraceae bacterium]
MKRKQFVIAKGILLVLCITLLMSCVGCVPTGEENATDNTSYTQNPTENTTDNTSHTDNSTTNTSYTEGSTDNVIISSAEIYDNYAVLPLCDTITALGFQLTWTDEDRATFVCSEIEYEISISGKALTKAGDDENYLIISPGSDHFVCEISNRELLVDDNTLECLFDTFLEYPINISIDHSDNRVTIVKQ